MLYSCRQEPSPADVAFSVLSLRTILVVVAVGGLVWREGNLGERWRENMLPERMKTLNVAVDTQHRACVTVTTSRSSLKSKPVV